MGCTGSKKQSLYAWQHMSSLSPTFRKTHDPEQTTSPFRVLVFPSVKWGEGLESAGSVVDGRACCFLPFSLYHCPRAASARPQ